MQWSEVLADKSLRDLPYKIELDRYGNIVMSPASNRHGRLQALVGILLERHLGSEAIIECSVDTPEGVKVADVAWCSPEFLARHGYTTPYPEAPEICVEVRSPSISNGVPARSGSCSKPAKFISSARKVNGPVPNIPWIRVPN